MISKEIIIIFSGGEFAAGNIASKILAVNIVFSIIDGAIYYQVLLPFGQEKYATLSTFIGAITNLVLNFVLIPKLSYTGAALTTLIAEFFVFIGLYNFGKRYGDLKSVLKYFVRYFILSILIIIWCLFTKHIVSGVFITVVVSVIESIVFYGVALFLTKEPIITEIYTKLTNKFR